MEVLSAVASGLTLAALFKGAFEALDLVQLYQTQDVDFIKLQLQFKLEKCRLYNWGVEMGLANDSKRNLLNDWPSKDLIVECLRQIMRLLSNAQNIQEKYGCVEVIPTTACPIEREPGISNSIASVFDNFRIQSSKGEKSQATALRRSKWIIRDRKKFLLLIDEVRGLIDSLQKITADLSSTARLEEALRSRIDGILDANTLLMIASVWKESHPRIASTASTRAESLSISSERKREISEWQTFISSESSDGTLIENLEDLTITELKHSVIQSNQEIATLKKALDETTWNMRMLMGDMSAQFKETKDQNISVIEGKTKQLEKEAVSIRTLTIITLVYLPATFVASFQIGAVLWRDRDQHDNSSPTKRMQFDAHGLEIFCITFSSIILLTGLFLCSRFYRSLRSRRKHRHISHNIAALPKYDEKEPAISPTPNATRDRSSVSVIRVPVPVRVRVRE